MAWDLRAGQLVVCVDDSVSGGVLSTGFFGLRRFWKAPVRHLVCGRVYTVADIWMGRHLLTGEDVVAVQLVEVPSLSSDGGFRASRFRPLPDSRIATLRALLNPKTHTQLTPENA